jgi:hypothetical protein
MLTVLLLLLLVVVVVQRMLLQLVQLLRWWAPDPGPACNSRPRMPKITQHTQPFKWQELLIWQ